MDIQRLNAIGMSPRNVTAPVARAGDAGSAQAGIVPACLSKLGAAQNSRSWLTTRLGSDISTRKNLAGAWRCPGDVEPGAVASSGVAAIPLARKPVLADVCAASLGGMLSERRGLVQ